MACPRNRREMMDKALDAARAYGVAGGACVYCGTPVRYKRFRQNCRRLTIDHFIPKGAGGLNVEANRVPACWDCNQAKGDRDPAEFVAMLGDRSRLTIAQIEAARAQILRAMAAA